jgi:transposase
MVSGELCAKRLVFVDEMGSNTFASRALRLFSEGREGVLLGGAKPGQEHDALLSSMTFWGMGPSMVVEGGTDGAVFEGYLREMLVPALRKGDVVVMDNLCVHKSETVRELIEGAGAHLLYLPPYSPDFNPIEEAFSKIKNLIRKAGARLHEALVVALSEAICEVSEEDAKAFFEHCGYREAVQLL